jgi:hypothetical protein
MALLNKEIHHGDTKDAEKREITRYGDPVRSGEQIEETATLSESLNESLALPLLPDSVSLW